MRKVFLILSLAFLAACGTGGYSFTGVDPGPAKSVSIDFFPNQADLVKPQLSQIFTEKLRDIFVQQTRLELVSRGGDMQFTGSIERYTIEPINAQASELGSVAQNRLTIDVNVIFINTLEPEKDFEERFTRFVDFDATADINAIEEELHDQVCQELSENILNRSIGDW